MNAKLCLILIVAVIGINVGIAFMLKGKKSEDSKATVSNEQLEQGYKVAHERAAKAMLKAVLASQNCYKMQYKQYALSFGTLIESGVFKKEALAICSRPGVDSKPIANYVYQMTSGKPWTKSTFFVRCKPIDEDSNLECYSVDATGKIVPIPRY